MSRGTGNTCMPNRGVSTAICFDQPRFAYLSPSSHIKPSHQLSRGSAIGQLQTRCLICINSKLPSRDKFPVETSKHNSMGSIFASGAFRHFSSQLRKLADDAFSCFTLPAKHPNRHLHTSWPNLSPSDIRSILNRGDFVNWASVMYTI